MVNHGALPLGVTPQNILHKTVKRNEHFANLCYALRMMEREGSGYDKMYEVLLSNGKQIPIVEEGDDYVKAIVGRRIISQKAIKSNSLCFAGDGTPTEADYLFRVDSTA